MQNNLGHVAGLPGLLGLPELLGLPGLLGLLGILGLHKSFIINSNNS